MVESAYIYDDDEYDDDAHSGLLLEDYISNYTASDWTNITINGLSCDASNVFVHSDGCVQGSPHYDPEGAVCANDGTAFEAYCSYGISDTA